MILEMRHNGVTLVAAGSLRAEALCLAELGACPVERTDMNPARISLMAPVTGVMTSLDQVPDPVFARKMVGDGFSVDPLAGRLVAPVAGEVVDVQPARHAVTIRSAEGLEVLMHIGLDTVALQGEGFTAHVKVGQQVAVGDPLIDFDLDEVGQRAKSLLTQVVITNMDRVASITPVEGLVTAGGSTAATVELLATTEEVVEAEPLSQVVSSEPVLIPNPTGMHARPAATLVALVKGFQSDVRLRKGDKANSAKSIMGILQMALAHGDEITVEAEGPDAAEAVAAVVAAIREGLGEEVTPLSGTDDTQAAPAVSELVAPVTQDVPSVAPAGTDDLLVGVSASPGLGIGQIVQLRRAEFEIVPDAADPAAERQRLDQAVQHSRTELEELRSRLEQEADADKAAIFAAHQEILEDPDLLAAARTEIDAGRSAAWAWRAAYTTFADQLAGLDNPILSGRATDVRDVGMRVLQEVTGQRVEQAPLPDNAILVAEELTPSDTAQLDRSKVVGFATCRGGASSHVAIIARSLDIPAVAGIEARALDLAEGTQVVLDGTRGTLRINVSDEEMADLRAKQARMAEVRAAQHAAKDEPAVTTDGHRVTVVANIGGVDDAVEAMTQGAEGVGLLRSEFVFMGRTTAPTEQEQREIYADCSKALGAGHPLVIRTLDVGGDKPLPYLPIPPEENPFLGIRGVRVGFEQPEVLRSQIRAVLGAADAGADLHVMFPMIATIDDWRTAKRIFDEEREKMPDLGKVSVGIMMEVPSVGVLAEVFAAEEGCDFFSVGTNDLTSYTLAMDRGHAKLAPQVDPCNPAVLMLIKQAADALHKRGKWLGVCGGVASDIQAVPILVGLGVDELSCSIPAIPAVKAAVRARSLAECRELADRALTCGTPAEVRNLVPLEEV